MKVLVCDDSEIRLKDVLAQIDAAHCKDLTVNYLVGGQLTTELEKLFVHVRSCIDDPESYKPAADLAFDEADIVLLDNNLAQLDVRGARLTAESIAGYIRAFTAVAYVVSLNKNPDVDFDLRYLVGDYSTRADLALNTDHLSNLALWTHNAADAKGGFLPWYWPKLADVAARRRTQVEFVRDRLEKPMLSVLGFPQEEEAIGFLSLHARGSLSPEASFHEDGDGGTPLEDVTFIQYFLAKDRSLPAGEERKVLADARNAKGGAIRDIIARIVASDLDLWFRRDVLGPQEVLVDLPHLLLRYPFLLGKRASNVDEWNKAVALQAEPYGIERKLYDEHLSKARFMHDVWVSSACFWWPNLKADEKLNEHFFESTGTVADVVFCEDTSLFVARPNDDRGDGGAAEFAAEFEGSWGRRFVQKLDGVMYSPRMRFAAF